jgi:hypothetical protein
MKTGATISGYSTVLGGEGAFTIAGPFGLHLCTFATVLMHGAILSTWVLGEFLFTDQTYGFHNKSIMLVLGFLY